MNAPPHIELFRLALVLGLQLRARMDHRLSAIGLTTQQAAVLTLAERSPGPTLGEVAAVLGTSHQNARQISDALARKGLVEVQVDAVDRRVRRVVATAAVAELFAGREDADHAAVREWFGTLSDEEIVAAVALLRRLLGALDRTP